MRRALSVLVTAAAVTGLAVGIGLLVTLHHGSATPGAAPPSAASTPLGDIDTTTLPVQRQPFCDRVPLDRVADALGDEPSDSASYGDGDRAPITRQVTDVAHEFDCAWSAGSGSKATIARAWVFAPPVTPDQADRLARVQRRAAFCKPLREPSPYGDPSVASRCHTRDGLQVSYRGLFGDAWLTCTLTGGHNLASLTDRAGRWCVAVAQAAAGQT